MRMLSLLLLPLAGWVNAAILDSKINNNVVYFIASESIELKRYSLLQETFLDPIPLSGQPTALHVNDSALYVSYGTQTYKMDLNGGNTELFLSSAKAIEDIASIGSVLFFGAQNTIQSVDAQTASIIDEMNRNYGAAELSAIGGSLWSTSAGVSPADIRNISVDANGSFGEETDSPYHSDYTIGTEAFPLYDDRVVYNSGIAYNAADRTYNAALGGSFKDLLITAEQLIVLRNSALLAYDKTPLITGVFDTSLETPTRIAKYDDNIFVFEDDFSAVQKVAIGDIKLPALAPTVDPTGIEYTPDSIELDKDGDTLYLLNKEHLNIFRWSKSQQAYLESIPLSAEPTKMVYAAQQDRIYLSFPEGTIKFIDLSNYSLAPFPAAPDEITSLAPAEGSLIVATAGSWSIYYSYNAAGELVFNSGSQYPSNAFYYIDTLDRFYYMTGSSIFYQTVDHLTGTFEYGNNSGSFFDGSARNPLRISENGHYLVTGGGRVLDADGLFSLGTLGEKAEYYRDVAWLHGNAFTLRSLGGTAVSIVERWQPNFQLDSSGTYETTAEPIALVPFAEQNELLLITLLSGVPQFTLLPYSEKDFDQDGYSDTKDAIPDDGNEWLDFDRDRIGDNADTDDDNDTYTDADDAFPFNKSEWADTDGDNIGDNADTDDDNDGTPDDSDRFPLNSSEISDHDNDGTGDNADPDDDNDGIEDSVDAFPFNFAESKDADGDGTGDNADLDDDNDGVEDLDDYYPNDPTRSEFNASVYMPLSSANRWTYNTNNSSVKTGNIVTVKGIDVSPLEFPSGNRLYFATKGNELLFYGLSLGSMETSFGTYSVDAVNTKGTPLISSGFSYYTSGSGTVEIKPTYGIRGTSWSVDLYNSGEEIVTVPAGTYTTQKVQLDYWATTVIDGAEVAISYFALIWFAEDVGIVQIEENGILSKMVSFTTVPSSGGTTSNSGGSNGNTSNGGGGSSGGGGGSTGLILLLLLGSAIVIRRRK
ncbi:Cobalamin biosynthesis protein CobT (nicotinate-mononucleotide:5, 6-dimethylbenzimidazole phosphoribosyltransferase) [Alteromonadaceae bacterium Bs31]|nr:Cobalamin biosynthesis protein CobT (nicotinate-mononucleotide:5, 6-dimethylbenzimidazole phosphoribosyltransferase) [Alteromonadaceae bacterium Bs31]